MPETPNRAYRWPRAADPATVPADMEQFLQMIDADVQVAFDLLGAEDRAVSEDLDGVPYWDYPQGQFLLLRDIDGVPIYGSPWPVPILDSDGTPSFVS